MNTSSRIFIFIGILFFLFGGFLLFQRYNPNKLSFSGDKFDSQNAIALEVFPKELIINSVKIDLPIYPSEIHDNIWEATTKGASYLATSPIPGDHGNSIIYGHNWENLMGHLTKTKPGDKVEIILSNGEKRTFVIEFTSLVSSDTTSILDQTSDARVTIYTCAGFLDTKRFVATAILL